MNLGNAPVELDVLSRIAQLQFSQTGEPQDEDKVYGRYSAATEPEFPDFGNDEEEYRKLRALRLGAEQQLK